MSLQTGTRLGPYEILSPLGAGGMGEVYRAKDTRLERTVAIKVLPSHLSSNPDLRKRFEREAKLISNLTHPNICTLHDIGHQDGIDYLVMEYLEGETLADRLSKGALPLDQALRYGIEICDALDKAHRQGIVHRDLKPGNIMLTKSGVKLLDFGLAKLRAPDEIKEVASVSALNTEVRELTAEGTILGTIQYMAPEQLEGKPTDTRTDIFAVGTVLYEMVSGKKAFEGKSRISLIAAILEKDPIPITALQPLAPPLLERLIKTCLAKDPDSRWQNAHDVAEELKWLTDRDSQSGSISAKPVGGKWRERIAWTLTALSLFSTILVALWAFRATRPTSAPVIYSSIELPRDRDLLLNDGALALSPDGQKLVFCTIDREGKVQLWFRLMNGATATPMAVGDHPFWSPDSRFVGFFTDDGKLKKLDITTGAVQTICDVANGRGGTWNQQGTIVFSPGSATGLYQVPASGGKASQITFVKGEDTHRLPHFLPDGRHLFFWYGSASKDIGGIYLLDLATREIRLIAKEASEAWYAEPGYLLFIHEGNLMAQPFDLKQLHLRGDAVSLAENVQYSSYRALGMFSISQNGMLLYRSFSNIQKKTLTWFDREGKTVGTIGEPAVIQDLRIAPDGKRVMVALADKSGRINYWIYDPQRPTENRFTFGPGPDCCLAWSPDEKYVVYQSYVLSAGFYLKAVDGSSPPQQLSSFGTARAPDWSPDGRTVAFTTDLGPQDSDVWLLNMSGDRKPSRFLQSQANEGWGRFSPDGHWFSYVSDESGKLELYVVPYPGPGGKWQISSGGATNSWWVNGGNEIVYLASDGKFISVEIATKNGKIEIGKQSYLPIKFLNAYEALGDFTPNGKYFLQPVPEENFVGSLTLVTNWPAILKKN